MIKEIQNPTIRHAAQIEAATLGPTFGRSKPKPLMLGVAMLVFCCVSTGLTAPLPYTGVNLAGAEFGTRIPGQDGRDYTYPTAAELDYFKSKRMNIIRLPFRWERLQKTLYAALDPTEWARMDSFVQAAMARDMVVILDPHNSARYHNQLIGSASVPVAAFTDFWSRLSGKFKTQDKVWFGLVNEPHHMSTEAWLTAANAAIAGIRNAGANNRILVPGNAYSGAHSWLYNYYGTANGTVMAGIVDPADNYIIEVHQYIDSDSSGTSTGVVSPTIGVERITTFTDWCRTNGVRALLGEFACPRSNTGNLNDPNYIGYRAIDNMLTYMEANNDVWLGWTWWAAGPWWGEYLFTLEPTASGVDRPQMSMLEPHIAVIPDADGDGMLDAWEVYYFGGTNQPAGWAAGDWDGDGFPNLSEYIAGTNPTNSASLFKITIQSSADAVYVNYPAHAATGPLYQNKARYYDLYSTGNLTGTWNSVAGQTNVFGAGGVHSYTNQNLGSANFFKVRARLEDR